MTLYYSQRILPQLFFLFFLGQYFFSSALCYCTAELLSSRGRQSYVVRPSSVNAFLYFFFFDKLHNNKEYANAYLCKCLPRGKHLHRGKPVSQIPLSRLMPAWWKSTFSPYLQTIFLLFKILDFRLFTISFFFFLFSLKWHQMGVKNSNDICSGST